MENKNRNWIRYQGRWIMEDKKQSMDYDKLTKQISWENKKWNQN